MTSYLDQAELSPVLLTRGAKQYVVISLVAFNNMQEEKNTEDKRRAERRKLLEDMDKYGPFELKTERYKDWDSLSLK